MTGVCRFGDYCTGHGCWPSRQNDQSSNNVFVNSLGAHRHGDHWITHCCVSCHDGILSGGSNNVFVNNQKLGMIGDTISCGSHVMTGSNNVFVNS